MILMNENLQEKSPRFLFKICIKIHDQNQPENDQDTLHGKVQENLHGKVQENDDQNQPENDQEKSPRYPPRKVFKKKCENHTLRYPKSMNSILI
jgi:hypothetical protein